MAGPVREAEEFFAGCPEYVPYRSEGGGVEVVDWRLGRPRMRGQWCGELGQQPPGAWIDDRPAVLPGDRGEERLAAQVAEVTAVWAHGKQHGVPVAGRGLHEVSVPGGDDGLHPAQVPVGEHRVGGVVPVRPGDPRAARHGDGVVVLGSALGEQQVVVALPAEQVRAFHPCRVHERAAEQDVLGAGDPQPRRVELAHPYFGPAGQLGAGDRPAAEEPGPPVVVEEQRGIDARHVVEPRRVRPWSRRMRGRDDEVARLGGAVNECAHHVGDAAGVAQGRREEPARRLYSVQGQLARAVEHMTYQLPVHQVPAAVDGKPREVLEGRGDQVIIRPDATDARVRMAAGHDGVAGKSGHRPRCARVVCRTTRLVGRVMWVVSWASPRMSLISRWMDCSPIWRMGWLTVVSGGEHSADSGMLSKPTTDRSSGTRRPSPVAASMVAIADTSLAAKTAVGGSEAVSSCRARRTETAAS